MGTALTSSSGGAHRRAKGIPVGAPRQFGECGDFILTDQPDGGPCLAHRLARIRAATSPPGSQLKTTISPK